MKQEEVKEYLDKVVRVVTKQGLKFHGKVTEICETTIILEDWNAGKVRKVRVDFFDISSISEK